MGKKNPPATKKVVKAKSINDTYNNLRASLENMETDVSKFESGQQAAGTRIRKGAQEIKKLCQSLRAEVTEIKNSRKA